MNRAHFVERIKCLYVSFSPKRFNNAYLIYILVLDHPFIWMKQECLLTVVALDVCFGRQV
jgi:hypothetical protein